MKSRRQLGARAAGHAPFEFRRCEIGDVIAQAKHCTTFATRLRDPFSVRLNGVMQADASARVAAS